MPLVHTVEVLVDDIDRFGSVPAHGLLGIGERVRWMATREPTFRFGDLFTGGNRMVLRAQAVESHRAVGIAARLDVSTWWARVGRTSLEIRHELRRADQGDLVARVDVVGVYLGSTFRPTPVPEWAHALVEDGPGVDVPPMDAGATAPAEAHVEVFRVRPADLDLFQHVNHRRYVSLMDDTRHLAAAAGAYGEAFRLASRPLRHFSIEYRREVVLGARVHIVTWALPADTNPSVSPPEALALGFELWDGPPGADPRGPNARGRAAVTAG